MGPLMKLGIMQPYIFPYIGYFHLIQASSLFVFYDDVHYIKSGWINRNRIINQDTDLLFTVPLSKSGSNKLIKEIAPAFDFKWKDKFYKQLVHSYKRAPFFESAIDQVMSPFCREYADITDLAIESILAIYSYLGIEFEYTKSSICAPETRGMDKADRLINITKHLGYRNYVNAPGGKELYSKEYFLNQGVNLSFIQSNTIKYKQYSEHFVPWLSIIDIIMFNGKDTTIKFLESYCLE